MKTPKKPNISDDNTLEKIQSLQEMIANAERTITSAKAMLSQLQHGGANASLSRSIPSSSAEGQIVHGNFDGQIMVGEDGKQYPVPANYASKSKLVEGDMLKLTITPDGNFVYKQIGPVDRKYLIGIVTLDERGNYTIVADGKKYKVLLAAATYFKIEPGDEVTLIVPRAQESVWGAIENVLRKATDVAMASSFSRPTDYAADENMEDLYQDEASEVSSKPAAIEKLEKEIEEERRRGLSKSHHDDIVDEWQPDIEALKKEASRPMSGKEEDEY